MLQGAKVRLRPVEASDATTLMFWENNPKHWRVSGTEIPFSMGEILAYINVARDIRLTGQLRYIIEDNEKRAVGAIDLFDANFKHRRAGVGVLIADETDRNNGFAKEALVLLKEYSKKMFDFHTLYCNILEDNLASIRLFESQGFKQIGSKKDWFFENNGWKDEHIYQVIL